jgi:hypothetical protein
MRFTLERAAPSVGRQSNDKVRTRCLTGHLTN